MLFTESGPSEEDARRSVLPAFLEIEPGRYKPVETCSREEIEAKIMSLTMQAQALLDEAKVLGRFLDGTE
jgi:hypothetical protein